MLIGLARLVCTALAGAAAAMVTLAAAAAPAAPSPTQTQTQLHVHDGHRVTLDVCPAAAPLRGAAILSHGFTHAGVATGSWPTPAVQRSRVERQLTGVAVA